LYVGGYQFVGSGVPVTREVSVLPPGFYPMQYLGRMSDGRTPALSLTDLFLEQRFRIHGSRRLAVAVTISNLFDQKTVISTFPRENETGTGLVLNESDLYAGRLDFRHLLAEQLVTPDARFLLADAYQGPRTARIMVKWTF
jgi:hypothetical protein